MIANIDMLSIAFDFSAVLVALFCFMGCGRRLASGKYNMLHVCIIVFCVMQALPIAVGWFDNLASIKLYYPYMYKAMVDQTTNYIYDLFVIFCVVILWHFASCFPCHRPLSISGFEAKIDSVRGLTVIIGMMTVFPVVIGVSLAPDPSVYLQFSFFTVHPNIVSGYLFEYNNGFMKYCTYVSFFATIVSYCCSKADSKIHYSIPVFLITWVNGKRTLLLFLLIAFVLIDFIKWDRRNRSYVKAVWKKASIFVVLFLGYYIVYNLITDKADFADDSLLYTIYFSRLCNVKVAIYDLLYSKSMLEYPFQNILYDLLFFIPRIFWPTKPYGYYPYFTSYIFTGRGTGFNPGYGFQVNLWSEYISNAGFFGFFLAIAFVLSVIWIAEKTSNLVTYVSGSAFIVLYFAYGFEHVVQMLWVVFIGSIVLSYLFRKSNLGVHEGISFSKNQLNSHVEGMASINYYMR